MKEQVMRMVSTSHQPTVKPVISLEHIVAARIDQSDLS
jgi:MoxR-like ATPase